MLSKARRLKLFFSRLEAAPAADSADAALELIARILNEVEDERSGVENNPDAWKDDGGMYPPREDNRRPVPHHPSLRRYRSAKHNTFVGLNGSVRIEDLDGRILLDKAGGNGRKAHELDTQAGTLALLDIYSIQGILRQCNMETAIERLKQLLARSLPKSQVKVDEPGMAGGNYWVDVSLGKKRHTLQYWPGKGFGLFQNGAGYGAGPAEIYRTPERAARRVARLMTPGGSQAVRMGLKDLRELYGQSQVTLAKKAGVKQPAISRFEKRGEVKLSTLAATIKALGGKLEVRAHFKDADVPISLSLSKG